MTAKDAYQFSKAFKKPGDAMTPEEKLQLDLESDDPQVRNMALMDQAAMKLGKSRGGDVPTDAGGVRADSGYSGLWGFGAKAKAADADKPAELMTPREAAEAKKQAEYEETLRKFREQVANQY